MSGRGALRKLFGVFVVGIVLVFANLLVDISFNREEVVWRLLRALRGELPLPKFPALEETKPKSTKYDDWYVPMRDAPKVWDYRELSSLSSPNGSYWPIHLGSKPGYNANLIPHPTDDKLWIVVAQREQFYEEFDQSEELACNAGFSNGALVCQRNAKALPIERSIFGICEGKLEFTNFRLGPRDARMFYGPEAPFLMYGSQSQYICMGLWIQDVRMMLNSFPKRNMKADLFKSLTELRRAGSKGPIEKNYFLFWDSQGTGYVHYNLWPERAFAQINADGSGAPDLSDTTKAADTQCMRALMPDVAREYESIHQATNSLAVTMCKRSEPGCVPNDDNTFIMHIFHHKGYYAFHGIYEPFVVLFRRNAPFAIHGISQKPLWVKGRADLTLASNAVLYRYHPEWIPENHSEFFYITSMSWKKHGQTYHGYADDELFLSFGIEDSRSGTIDILAGDMLKDIAFCHTAAESALAATSS